MGRYSLIAALAVLAVAAGGCPPPSALDRAYTLHTSWLDSGDREALEQAADAYGEHVTGCPGTENCFEAFRRLGDLLMELDRHQEAAQAHRRAADLLLELDPELRDRTGVRYQTAFLLYQRRHYDDASDRWRQMAEIDPGAAETLSAMQILLPTHHAREAWAELVRDGGFFLGLAGLPLGAAERANLETMVEEARAR